MRQDPLTDAPSDYGQKRDFARELGEAPGHVRDGYDIRSTAEREWQYIRTHPEDLSMDQHLFFRESLPWLAQKIDNPDDFEWISAIVLDDELDARGVNPVLGSIRIAWVKALPECGASTALLEEWIQRKRSLGEVHAALYRLREIGDISSLPVIEELKSNLPDGADSYTRRLISQTERALNRRRTSGTTK